MPYGDYNRDVLDHHNELKTARALEEGTWRELARLLRPDDTDFAPNEIRRRDDFDVYDATPLYALDSFVGGVFSQAINPANRWFELELEDADLQRWRPVQEWTYRQTNKIYGSLSPSVSAFYSRAPAWLANLGAFGFGPFYQEEDLSRGAITDLVIPIGETYFDRDQNGNLQNFHREFSLSGRQVVRKFGTAWEKQTRADNIYTIVHAVGANDDYRPDMLGPRGMPMKSCYVSPDIADFREEGGYFELPYHVPMWNERAKSAYPTGPGHNQKADAQMLQQMERSHLVAGQHAAEPMLLTKSEDILSVADILPNNVLYGAITEGGKRLVETLDRKQQLQLTMAQSEQRRQMIRNAFLFNLMQLVQRPQMTATEFLGFQEETLKLMAPNLVKVQTGGLSPFISRRFRILERNGQIDPPPRELTGKRINIKYVSALARLLQVAKGRGVLNFQAALEQMAVTDPSVRDHFNGDKAVPIVREAFTEVIDVVRDPREVEAIRKARLATQQQQQQIEQMGALVETAAVASHAEQASSAAKQRVKAA